MSITSYAELKTAIGSWLNRDNLADTIPDFITLAEQMMAGDPDGGGIRVRAMEKRVTATVAAQYIDAPTDLLEMRNFQLNTDPVRRLRYMTPEQLDTQFASSATGKPQAFTLIGDEIQLAPIPGGSYTAEIAYYSRFVPLSDVNTTNWLLTNHPGLYLYGSLIQAEPFLSNDARMATWAQMYNSLADALNLQEHKARYSGSVLAVRNDVGNP